MLGTLPRWPLVVVACAITVTVARRIRHGPVPDEDAPGQRLPGLLDRRWKPPFILAAHTFLFACVWWMILRDMDGPSTVPVHAATWHRYTIHSAWLIFNGGLVALIGVAWWRAAVSTQISHRLNRLIARLLSAEPS
jgi:hypothetical protein